VKSRNRNHINGYHGSSKDECIYCCRPNAPENQICPERSKVVDGEEAYDLRELSLCRRLMKTLKGKERSMFEHILFMADIDLDGDQDERNND
jgi:hypothetical protein